MRITVELIKDVPLYRLGAGTHLFLIEEQEGRAWLTNNGRGGWFFKDEYTTLGRARMQTKVVKDSQGFRAEEADQQGAKEVQEKLM